MKLSSPVINWLLEDDEPSLKYRVLTELLGQDKSLPEIQNIKKKIPHSNSVMGILHLMHPDGYWLQKNPRGDVVGDGVEYGSFASTHFCLAYLSELGMDRSHPQVEKAAERYLSLQQVDGDWWMHLSCLTGYNIRTFAHLGYRDDARVQRALNLLLQTNRWDGGCLCDLHEKGKKGRMEKSCIRGSVKVLLAFTEYPEIWNHPGCKQLVEYFLRRGGIFQSAHPGVLVNKDMNRQAFPITWRTNAWEVLYALGVMGHARDERLLPAWLVMEQHLDSQGRLTLDWTPTQCPWKVGERGKPNKWLTFYWQACLQYKNGNN